MATRSVVELDFFRMEKKETSSTKPLQQPHNNINNKLFDRRRSFRDIQSVISKLNPDLLKSVISSGISKPSSVSVPSTPTTAFPVYTPPPAFGTPEKTTTAPLTIFYNGAVAVFDVPRHKAEDILKLAEGGGGGVLSKTVESANEQLLLNTLNGDVPIPRTKSLQRFLEKRKERLTLASPYGCPTFFGKIKSGQRD